MSDQTSLDQVAAMWFARGLELYATNLDKIREQGHARTERLEPPYRGKARDIFEAAMINAAERLRLAARELEERFP